ncbi:Bro-N domain-containing protein (plasmid) [Bacillus carboniphilus]|uniref:Bro-N domain-containing protein n=1 Tax=Bacillus carboniphilus TaxID=86663 RepID=A0ABY9JYJ5_9BACI|nr:Bro-N domain-containing protein [Bacillus carboniphilus]WLR44425.1 Bro-N domain-containing protein [Bacillus carboniphilus]
MKLTLCIRRLNKQTFDFYVNEHNQMFMTQQQIADVLGYSSKKSVRTILHRHKFLDDLYYAHYIDIEAGNGQVFPTKALNKYGLYELSLLSTRPEAESFRKFLRDQEEFK